MPLDPGSEFTPAAPESAAEHTAGPRIYGVIDVLRSDRIAGWAIDRSDSAAALDVDVLREGRVIRTVRADRHRADLEKGGIGTGRYGFRAEIAPPLEPGFEFTLVIVARAPDGASAALKRVGAAAGAQDPATRVLERIYERVAQLPTGAERPEAASVSADVGRLTLVVERIETAQGRIEAALASIEPSAPTVHGHGLRAIVFAALGVAVLSLSIGVYSLWAP